MHLEPTAANNSITRPTLASLARQTSRNNLDIIASPPSISSKPGSLSVKQHALSPQSKATDKNTLLSPRSNAGTQAVEKKKVSSISAAHRNSPIKPGLDDSIAQARRIRAKKLGAQMQQSTAPAPSSNAQVVRSPSKSMALSANGSISSRPAWR